MVITGSYLQGFLPGIQKFTRNYSLFVRRKGKKSETWKCDFHSENKGIRSIYLFIYLFIYRILKGYDFLIIDLLEAINNTCF